VTGTLRVAVREPGFYFFPGLMQSPGLAFLAWWERKAS
jgi:hypothetical protein